LSRMNGYVLEYVTSRKRYELMISPLFPMPKSYLERLPCLLPLPLFSSCTHLQPCLIFTGVFYICSYYDLVPPPPYLRTTCGTRLCSAETFRVLDVEDVMGKQSFRLQQDMPTTKGIGKAATAQQRGARVQDSNYTGIKIR